MRRVDMLEPRRSIGAGFILSAFLLIFSFDAAQAQTTVTRNAECSVTIVVPIEIFGPLATPELVNRWKKNIEAMWNGPSEEMIKQIAQHNDILDPDHLTWDRDKLNKLYQDFMRSIGRDGSCAEINCCQICVRVDIRIRKPGQPDPHYHQVEVVPNGFVRSYVQWGDGGAQSVFKGGTSGSRWENDPGGVWPPEAHEVGHLLGLDDDYEDTHDASGKVTGSKPKTGHDDGSVMANVLAWPEEAAYATILERAGLPKIDCCKDPTVVTEVTNKLIVDSRTAITSCDRDMIQRMILELQAQRSNLAKDNVPLRVRYELIQSIDKTLAQLEKALSECPVPTETFTVFTGFDGTIWCTFGDGIWIPMVFVPTNDNVPVTPIPPPTLPPGEVFQPRTPGPPPSTPGEPPGKPPGGNVPTAGPPPTPEQPQVPTDPPPAQTPTNAPPTDVVNTPDNPTQTWDTIFVKAKQTLLEGGQTGQSIGGQTFKLFPSNTPDLPGNGPKADAGFDKDPVQTRLGSDGSGTMKVNPQDRRTYQLPDNPGKGNFRVDVDLPHHDGGIVETTGHKVDTNALVTPNGVKVTPTEFSIGNRTFLRFGFDIPFGQNASFTNFYTPLLPGFGIDFCREKQPGPPAGMQAESLSALNHELPEATLHLTRTASVRGVKR